MISHTIEGSTKRNICLSYGMVLTMIFREFGVPITEGETKRLLRHTDIYSTQSLYRMGFQKVHGEWKRIDTKKKATDEGEPSWPSVSLSRVASPPLTQLAPIMPSSTIQLEDDQVRKITTQVTKELWMQNPLDQT